MEIIGDDKQVDATPKPTAKAGSTVSTDSQAVTNSGGMTDFDKTVVSVFSEFSNTVEEAQKKDDPLDGTVDVAKHVASSPVLSAAGDMSSASLSKAKEMLGEQSVKLVTEEHKSEFINSLVSGKRYTERFSLFGGSLSIKVRCRSTEETDAIDSYSRRKVSTGEIKSESEYANLMRCMLIVAQVEEVNGVSYPEMRKPLKFREDDGGMHPPEWEKDLSVWMAKPDVIISALTGAVLEFEARYWHMVSRASDSNFWLPGESTGA